MVKMSDVAKEAGVSVATVSRALSARGNVNKELVARVQQAADALGYRPNSVARNLRKQSTDLLGLLISDISNPFFTAVTRGVEDVAQVNGLSVMLCNTDEQPEKEETYLRVVEQERVAGVLISPHSDATDVSRLIKAKIPLVVIDRPLAGNFDSVMVESSKGAQCATRHLLESGWKKPACITGPPTASTAQQRLEGYLAALWHHYEDSVRPMVSRGEFRQEGGRQAAAELLDRKDPPDSLFIANAQMALGVLEEIRSRKLVIGVDLGIVVFDDAPWAPFVDPPITVVAQPAYEIGKRAAQLLIDRINGSAPDHCRHEILTTELILRKSSTRVDKVGS